MSGTGQQRLTALVRLESRLLQATSLQELGFILCNEAAGLLPYRQALLLGRGRAGRRVLCFSGAVSPASDVPYARWARRLLRRPWPAEERGLVVLTAAQVDPALRAGWAEWLPPVLVCVPLRHRGVELGVVAYGRDAPPDEAERQVLALMTEAASHCWAALARAGRLRPGALQPRRRWLAWLLGTAAAAALATLPVPSSVLAPAEVVAREPAHVRAPLDGVIEQLAVRPNQAVQQGQLLGRYEERRLRTQLEVSRRTADATEAELRQQTQASITDSRARSALPATEGRYRQQLAELDYLRQQMERVELRAPRAGVVLLDNPNEWVGRPVSVGERILQLADPAQVELEIRLPVAEAIDLETGAEVRFFRSIDPDAPLHGRLVFSSYRASAGPDAVVAYRLRAQFAEGVAPPRLGLTGVAKIYGPDVSLGYYLARRPLASLRSLLGL